MIVIAIPSCDFDPTEVAVTWKILKELGCEIIFATPNGKKAEADLRMIHGNGLLFWSPFLRANKRARDCYNELIEDPAFLAPKTYEEIQEEEPSILGMILPGGHAPGMKEYLESKLLQNQIVQFFEKKKPVGAICHGTLLVARSISPKTQKSVLYGLKTTTLPKDMELTAWAMTCLWLKNYYRTYPTTTQEEVISFLKEPKDFQRGPMAILRDHPNALNRGFVVRDQNYISARWPGDVHRFATEFYSLLEESSNSSKSFSS